MGGKEAIKGFWYQTISTVLFMVNDNKWKYIEIEPSNEYEKADFKIYFEKSLEIKQIKSTKYKFRKGEIINIISSLKSMEADKITLTLIAQDFSGIPKEIDGCNIEFVDNNEENLLIRSANNLAEYLEKNYRIVESQDVLKTLVHTLIGKHIFPKELSRKISRKEFTKTLKEYIYSFTPTYWNKKITQAFEHLESNNSGRELIGISEIGEIIKKEYKPNELIIALSDYLRNKAQSEITFDSILEKYSVKEKKNYIWKSRKEQDFSKNIQHCLNILLDYNRLICEEINLSELFLPFVDLSNKTCHKLNFNNSYLEKVCIENSKFIECNFDQSKLIGIHLLGNAQFIKCGFKNANLSQSMFNNCDFQKSDFSQSFAKNSQFNDTNLEKCNFRECHFYNCEFYGANFNDALMAGTKFEFCDLRNIRLSLEQIASINLLSKCYLEEETERLIKAKYADKIKI